MVSNYVLHQGIISPNADLPIGPSETNFGKILIKKNIKNTRPFIQRNEFEMLPTKWQPFCLGFAWYYVYADSA